ncbi:CBS domain-containing protein [Litorilituus lipolyticus]|uniref:CBS domain-containing protein n=1 Tax=Litorilituus lipolyticus TaxID=2491017 RepID=A0A502KKQ5_9GAMM|nr:CBS domain-containing protein [Litorilituus lipolyticus]TPH12180.1 CBS domain-containing protein [Litorilituus lipolyticus]
MSHKLVQVKDVLNDRFHMVDGKLTVLEAMKVAQKYGSEALVIEKRHDHDEFGFVTLADIAKQVISKDKSPERVNVYEIMAKPVLGVRPDMDVRYCARLFERFGISKAPVIDGEEVLGMVGYEDIVLKGMYSE